ncbi:hypothetical protein NIES4071_18990 [Calothrix sp. NIES-4071]|nr:hypothetical protein NIES4071_18990 [Calothrix sp. NIES-4071]BAZ56232.1 hypothetical protein NIES4105_18940 [Calothrix sp. NIES-4105]
MWFSSGGKFLATDITDVTDGLFVINSGEVLGRLEMKIQLERLKSN